MLVEKHVTSVGRALLERYMTFAGKVLLERYVAFVGRVLVDRYVTFGETLLWSLPLWDRWVDVPGVGREVN